MKRSSSPPRGAPKKRTAFIDITNVSKCAGCCSSAEHGSISEISAAAFLTGSAKHEEDDAVGAAPLLSGTTEGPPSRAR